MSTVAENTQVPPEKISFTFNEHSYYIETFTGKKFYPARVSGNYIVEFSIKDIAHALAMETRYGGHCKSFYSVAEHSCRVFDLWKELHTPSLSWNKKHGLHVLLHDAHEAYFKDMPYPIKKLEIMSGYRILSELCQKKILSWFNAEPTLPDTESKLLKKIDIYLRYQEAKKLMETKGETWDWPKSKDEYIFYKKESDERNSYAHFENERKELPVSIECWETFEAEEKFLNRFMECWS